MFIMIDNYDSFAHNLARYFECADAGVKIIRNDACSITDIQNQKPRAIIISPGPKAPKDAGICLELIKSCAPTTPILGICLGYQIIGEAFGGTTEPSGKPIHGRASIITHNRSILFQNIPSPMNAARYHALKTTLPSTSELNVIAKTQDGEAMAVQHKTYPTIGLQFHPESILTKYGQDIINNFVQITNDFHAQNKGLAA